jgi:type IV pilus assembly protein PilN
MRVELMTQINLLPWREQKRTQQKKQLIRLLVLSILATFIIVFVFNYYVTEQGRQQRLRNQIVQQEITAYQQQLSKINNLQKSRDELIARMSLVSKLQSTRILMVHLFDELSKITPSGIYLTRMEGKNKRIIVSGYATSNKHVAQIMKNIEQNEWIHHPVLQEIKKVEDKQSANNEFKLTFALDSSSKNERVK